MLVVYTAKTNLIHLVDQDESEFAALYKDGLEKAFEDHPEVGSCRTLCGREWSVDSLSGFHEVDWYTIKAGSICSRCSTSKRAMTDKWESQHTLTPQWQKFSSEILDTSLIEECHSLTARTKCKNICFEGFVIDDGRSLIMTSAATPFALPIFRISLSDMRSIYILAVNQYGDFCFIDNFPSGLIYDKEESYIRYAYRRKQPKLYALDKIIMESVLEKLPELIQAWEAQFE